MKTYGVLLILWSMILCGCQTASPTHSASEQRGKLSLRINLEGTLVVDLHTARIYVDSSFVGNYAVEMALDLPKGKHKIAVQVPQAYQARLRNDGTTEVKYFKLAGEETIAVLGGHSVQNLVFDLHNLKRTEIDVANPH